MVGPRPKGWKDGIAKLSGPRGIRWRAKVFVGGRSVEKSFGTEKQAREWRDQQRASRDTAALASNVTFYDALDRFVEARSKSKGWQRATLDARRQQIKMIRDAALDAGIRSDTPLRKLDAGLCEEIIGNFPAGLSARTKRPAFDLLKSVFQRHVDRRQLDHNPMSALDAPPLAEAAARAEAEAAAKMLDADGLEALVKGLEGKPAQLPVRILCETGMRVGELCALRWSDCTIDAAPFALRVGGTVDRGGRKDISKAYKHRMIPNISGTLAEALRQQRAEIQRHAAIAALDFLPDWLVFPREGAGWPTRPMSGDIMRTLIHVDAPGLSPHSLRRSNATVMLELGIPLTTVAKRLGDKTTTVLKHYLHGSDKASSDAGEKMAAVLNGKVADSGVKKSEPKP